MIARVEDDPGKTIVIVDDEMSFTDLLGRLLAEHFRSPILTFSNPLSALEALPHLNVGVLVTDYYMPHLNGLELIRKAGDLGPAAPACILITGHSLENSEDEVSRLIQFRAVLYKPFRWQQLAALIEKNWPADAPSPLRASEPSF